MFVFDLWIFLGSSEMDLSRIFGMDLSVRILYLCCILTSRCNYARTLRTQYEYVVVFPSTRPPNAHTSHFTYSNSKYFSFSSSGGFSEWICENTEARSAVLPLDDPTINQFSTANTNTNQNRFSVYSIVIDWATRFRPFIRLNCGR